jgi:hypothetical protein
MTIKTRVTAKTTYSAVVCPRWQRSRRDRVMHSQYRTIARNQDKPDFRPFRLIFLNLTVFHREAGLPLRKSLQVRRSAEAGMTDAQGHRRCFTEDRRAEVDWEILGNKDLNLD